jgi:DNA modification methylase
MTNFDKLIEKYNSIKISNGLLNQEELDLDKDRNTNIFAYRGQFSPDLVRGLILKYAKKNDILLDPFAGCGTTLFEGGKLDHSVIGSDINPSGFIMGQMTTFYNLSLNSREKIIINTNKLIDKIKSDFDNKILYEIKNTQEKHEKILLMNAYIKYKKGKVCDKETFKKTVDFFTKKIMLFPHTNKNIQFYNCDARKLKLKQNSINFIVTSPPYINVFNYHQHDRKAIESLGFNALTVAKSEFGANRKHRQNRILTVTQYILDMGEVMSELRGILTKDGSFILIIGRETTVRGIKFRNDLIIAIIGYLLGYDIPIHQQRKFKNQFGEMIYEDILHFKIKAQNTLYNEKTLREWSKHVLKSALSQAKNEIVKNELIQAIDKVTEVHSSSMFQNENTTFR